MDFKRWLKLSGHNPGSNPGRKRAESDKPSRDHDIAVIKQLGAYGGALLFLTMPELDPAHPTSLPTYTRLADGITYATHTIEVETIGISGHYDRRVDSAARYQTAVSLLGRVLRRNNLNVLEQDDNPANPHNLYSYSGVLSLEGVLVAANTTLAAARRINPGFSVENIFHVAIVGAEGGSPYLGLREPVGPGELYPMLTIDGTTIIAPQMGPE